MNIMTEKPAENKKKRLSHVNIIARLIFIGFASIPLIKHDVFMHHFKLYLSGSNIAGITKGEWPFVVYNIIFFLSFSIPLAYRRKINWSEYGLVVAFFVSLFVEMYGVPFTLLFFSSYFDSNIPMAPHVFTFSIFGVRLGMNYGMAYGGVIITIGMLIVMWGWLTLYRNIKKTGLVTSGIYAYSRHPQYLGFLLIIVGWTIGWPTIMSVIFAIILIIMYLRVCFKEESEVSRQLPEYADYKRQVPFFI